MENQNVQAVEHKKRSLRRYRKNRACIDRLEEKLDRLDQRIKSVRSPNYLGMPRVGTPVTIADLLSDKSDLEARIERLKQKGKRLKYEVLDEIDLLEDPRYSEVLEAYYIDCMSIEQIAEEMGYTTRWTYDLYSQAIEELVEVSDGVCSS